MEEINDLLQETGLSSVKGVGFTIVSIAGITGNPPACALDNTRSPTTISVTLANNIVGKPVFVNASEPKTEHVVELVDNIQLYVDKENRTIYLFLDAAQSTSALAEAAKNRSSDEKTAQPSFSSHVLSSECSYLRGLLFLCLISHLVIPILPSSLFSSEFLSNLVTLSQTKQALYTHLAQFQAACWRHWDIGVPYSLFEKRETEGRRGRDRINQTLPGWWGPAKGVPLMAAVIADVPVITEGQSKLTVPVAVKRLQESLQGRIKYLFRAVHLIPLSNDAPSAANEIRSLFTLPSSTQSFLHVVPRAAVPLDNGSAGANHLFTFDEPVSLEDWLNGSGDAKDSKQEPPKGTSSEGYDTVLLRNFVAHWMKASRSKSSLSNSRKSDIRPLATILPNGLQFISAAVTLRHLILQPMGHMETFRKFITSQVPGTKGMIQQIEVTMRKKIRDTVEIERAFSKSHSLEIMAKAVEAYLHDLPSYYTQQYHLWKRNSVVRLYRSLARGPCAEDFAARLMEECDATWKQGRQGCEVVSFTGKVCRLKLGHGDRGLEIERETTEDAKAESRSLMDKSAHSSGCSFFHACNCGKTQKLREDPFQLSEANLEFYQKFGCCMIPGRVAIDIQRSTFGANQTLAKNTVDIPLDDTVLLYLGPASIYRNSFGLDKYEGFTHNTNYLLPWNLTGLVAQHAKAAPATGPKPKETTSKLANSHEWPSLGATVEVPSAPAAKPISPHLASLSAFPSLKAATSGQDMPTASTSVNLDVVSSRSSDEPKRDTRRRRDGRRNKDREHRLEHLVRAFLGAEYECPLGHRFLSCGDGRICKIGHKGHPKEHGNDFIHQDLPLYVLCPCNFVNPQQKSAPDVTAQLQRLYIVTPDAPVAITMHPSIKIQVPDTDRVVQLDLGIHDTLTLPSNGLYVLRLPYIYRDTDGSPIPMEPNTELRLKSGVFEKGCFKAQYRVDR
ncbi:uncharacterized protein BYT42DRAFT_588691 [Radiomyces spectabilis]|uniref:uncharacterized protein n=1 Tax=Radiomyces spectabilis TaxID=64574 RepID=UPI00221F569A|nr:uncharacterized protein BYT42DRAFT_588691 [Radiomyces spectabilis]KAI8366044.1 hypothetical protein BYT42DRAFT_588691 [Radiomyces spectabilis]